MAISTNQDQAVRLLARIMLRVEFLVFSVDQFHSWAPIGTTSINQR